MLCGAVLTLPNKYPTTRPGWLNRVIGFELTGKAS